MNILLGKFGRSIYFNKKKWSIYAGDEEAPLLFIALAKAYPQHTFYMVGRSDLTAYRNSKHGGNILFGDEANGDDLVVPDNVVDLWNGFVASEHNYVHTIKAGAPYSQKLKEAIAAGTCTVIKEITKGDSTYVYTQPREDWHKWMERRIAEAGLKFDAGVVYQGPTPAVGIPNEGIIRVDGAGDAQTQLMFKMYYAPIMHVLNITQVPYVLVNGDPRYVPLLHRDCFNDERVVLSQINVTKRVKRITGYGDASGIYRMVDVNYVYAGVETVFMLDQEKVDFRNLEKPHQFVMGLNGGGDREQIVTDWVLRRPEATGVKIYGKWPTTITDKYPGVFEEKGISEVADVFWGGRYTFIPPFYNGLSSFVTQKFWKMILYGIIPFFHPKYDTDRIFNMPDALRPRTPDEMWATIKRLDANPGERSQILDHLWSLLRDDYYTGEFLINKVNAALRGTSGIDLRATS